MNGWMSGEFHAGLRREKKMAIISLESANILVPLICIIGRWLDVASEGYVTGNQVEYLQKWNNVNHNNDAAAAADDDDDLEENEMR